jgi:hypothetical protein
MAPCLSLSRRSKRRCGRVGLEKPVALPHTPNRRSVATAGGVPGCVFWDTGGANGVPSRQCLRLPSGILPEPSVAETKPGPPNELGVQNWWMQPGTELQHPQRLDEDEMLRGIAVVGLTLERAVTWADELVGNEGPRLRLPADQLSGGVAQLCFALLTAERALIEFVTGPATTMKQGSRVKANADDICPRCFVSTWTLSGYLRDHLRARRTRINKHLSHLTWPQTVSRQWHTTPITLVADALAQFQKALDTEQQACALRLGTALANVSPATERLRQAKAPELFEYELLRVSVSD